MPASAANTMVLLPTYLEAGNVGPLIDALLEHLPGAEILVIDDQSPDGTANLVRERYGERPSLRAITRRGVRGYGPSMREGMALFLESHAQCLLTMDADLSHDPAAAPAILDRVPPNGLAVGSRYVGRRQRRERVVGRLLASALGNYYLRALTSLPVSDCTSGFRCYSRRALELLDLGRLRSMGYAFQVESLYWLWRAGCPIVEVPIVYRERSAGRSKLDARIVMEDFLLPWRLVARAPRRSSPPDLRP